jgi:hypothetical protein
VVDQCFTKWCGFGGGGVVKWSDGEGRRWEGLEKGKLEKMDPRKVVVLEEVFHGLSFIYRHDKRELLYT